MTTTMLVFLPLLLGAAAPAPGDFACRNTAAEIACTDGGCEVKTPADGFTPMGLSLTGNMIELCAYSSCQSGRVLTRRTRASVTYLHAKLAGEGGQAPTDISVLYDAAEKVALMRWMGFANAMGCGPSG